MKLSIITVCFNEKENIEQTLKSVVEQDFKDFEYIVIDGGSTDGTVEIIKKYQPSIGFFVSEKDSGVYNAMNKGIAKATGEYLLFLNGGDFIYDNKVLSRVFGEHDIRADIVYGDEQILKNDNSRQLVNLRNEVIGKKFWFNRTLPHQSTFMKKKLFDEFGLYDERYKIAADYDFFMKCLYKNKHSFQYVPLTIAVWNDQGISNQEKYREQHLAERRQIQKKFFSFWDDRRFFTWPSLKSGIKKFFYAKS
jgi:glycosyltransferase involved in cell wall biosynthesis